MSLKVQQKINFLTLHWFIMDIFSFSCGLLEYFWAKEHPVKPKLKPKAHEWQLKNSYYFG